MYMKMKAALARWSEVIESLPWVECWLVPSLFYMPLPLWEVMRYVRRREQWKSLKVMFQNEELIATNSLPTAEPGKCVIYIVYTIYRIYKVSLFWKLASKAAEFDVQQQSVGYNLDIF